MSNSLTKEQCEVEELPEPIEVAHTIFGFWMTPFNCVKFDINGHDANISDVKRLRDWLNVAIAAYEPTPATEESE